MKRPGGYNGGLFKVETRCTENPKDFFGDEKTGNRDFKISAALNNIGIKVWKRHRFGVDGECFVDGRQSVWNGEHRFGK